MRSSTLRWARPNERKLFDLRLITRCEYERSCGWWVRVERLSGYRRSKMFSDSKFGGRQGALESAVRFRDEAEAEAPPKLPKPGRPRRLPRGYIRKAQRCRNVNGARVYYQAWIAYYFTAEGRHLETSYSCLKWGSDEARAKAEAWLRRTRLEAK